VSPEKASSSNDDDDDGLYVRPISIKILVPVSLAAASIVAVIGLYLGNETVVTPEHLTPLRVWAIRVLVLVTALVAGWQVKRRSRRRPR
jgi:predicted tellurium resistance membrane protein TerC